MFNITIIVSNRYFYFKALKYLFVNRYYIICKKSISYADIYEHQNCVYRPSPT